MIGDGRGAREQQVIEGELRERAADFGAALEYGDFGFVIGRAEHALHQFGCTRGEFAGLDHGAVAGGEAARERRES